MGEIQNNTSFYAILMLIAGIGIPIMAALNAGLGEKLQSPALAATILFFVGMIASIAYMLVFEGTPKSLYNATTPVYFSFGRLFVLFYFYLPII